MAQPTTRDVHVDAALSNISIAYKNAKYIADMVFPIIPVDKASDYYYTWTKDFWFRNHVERRGPGAVYAEAGLQLSTTQYNCVNKGLSFPIPDEIVANEDAGVDIEAAGAEFLADQFLLDREIAIKGKIMDASVWTSSTTLSGTDQWSDYENSDPLGDIDTGIETIKGLTGQSPNVALVNEQGLHRLRRHPDLLDLYKYTVKANLTLDQIAQAIGVEKILVGDAVYNSANEGATFSGAYIWDKNMILMYVAPSPGLLVPSAGYSFVWKQYGFTVPITRVRDELRDREILKANHAFDQKVTSADCGYEIINCVA